MFDEKGWIKLHQFQGTEGTISGIFEINNIFYVVNIRGISTLNNEFYKYQSNELYDWCATCRVGNSILVVGKKYGGDDVKFSLFNPINKQWSGTNIEIKRKLFNIVYYFNKVRITGGYERVEHSRIVRSSYKKSQFSTNKNE